MAEPVRKLPSQKDTEPDDETSGTATFLRWVERPDGRLELLEMPLTPEVFLDPQLEDQMTQGEWHSEATTDLAADIRGFLRSKREDVLVLSDVKHYLGISGLPNPAPDVSVIYGICRRLDKKRPNSFDLVKERVRPSFVLEVISPDDRRLREADEVDKVEIYERVGIPEYFLLDTPHSKNGFRLHLKGYRLNSRGRYRLIRPDPEGRLLSEQTGLWFSVSPAGDRVVLVDVATGRKVLSREEQETTLRAAEERSERAEAEIARLREQLKQTGG